MNKKATAILCIVLWIAAVYCLAPPVSWTQSDPKNNAGKLIVLVMGVVVCLYVYRAFKPANVKGNE
ncbi:MAG: hypothetical protein ABI367_05220 [Mucilaginibacter sp.]